MEIIKEEKEVVKMDETHNNNIKVLFRVVTVVVTIVIILFIIYGIKLGIFQDKMVLVNYMKKFGILAPLFFIFLQIFQVVFPVIPGGASCLAGVLAFGSVLGFIYNYVGLIIGSIIVFYLSRKYGQKLVYKLFDKDNVDKYLGYIKTNKFNKIFFLGIFLPGFPDDLLCYVAGLSNMKFRTFFWIIVLGKPLALLMYSAFIQLF